MNPKITMAVRILFGAFLLFFGLNKFLHFMEFPPMPGNGGNLMDIYMSSGCMYLIGVLEVVCGIALLTNKFVPLALTIATAIMFNAVVFHGLHHIETIPGAILGLVLSLVLVYFNKERFNSLLSM